MANPGRKLSRSLAKVKQLALDLSLDQGATFESFFGGENEAAVAQLGLITAQPAWLYLWGPTGSGKTHLLNAVCHKAGAQKLSSCLLPLTQYTRFSAELLDDLDALDVICLDDIDAIAGHALWEEAVFHLLNRLRDKGVSIVMAANQRPGDIALSLPDLSSRLGWGTLIKLKLLSDADKISALQLRARLRGFDLPPESANYLMRRVARDTASLVQLLDRIDTASMQAKRKLTVPFLREVLRQSDTGRINLNYES